LDWKFLVYMSGYFLWGIVAIRFRHALDTMAEHTAALREHAAAMRGDTRQKQLPPPPSNGQRKDARL
jgi:hypothetical protein